MPLSLNHLRHFVAVAEHGGFRHAARALYISQPAISSSIQELEKDLGMPLFDRSRRGVRLTEAGELLLSYGRRLFNLEQEAERALEQLRGLETGHLALAASQTIGTYLLPPLLAAFRQQYPGIRLALDIGNTQQVIEKLRTEQIDLAFVEGRVNEPDLITAPWRKDRLVMIAPVDNSWGLDGAISMSRLAELPYVHRERGSGTGEIIEQALSKHGVTLNVTIELGSNQAVKQAVIAGLGVSIVSEATIVLEREAGQLRVIELEAGSIEREFLQVNVRGRIESRALMAFRALLDDNAD